MDLDDWEILSKETFIDLDDDQRGNKNIISPKTMFQNTITIDMDYFHEFEVLKSRARSRDETPYETKDSCSRFEELPEEVIKLPIESSQSKYDPLIQDQNFHGLDQNFDDHAMINNVFLKKSNENEFFDTKSDVPKSSDMAIMPQTDMGTYKIDQNVENDCNFVDKKKDEKLIVYEENNVKMEENMEWKDQENGGVNIWKWAMTGMGALVTFGFAAVTVSLVVFSNRHKESNHSKKQDLHFQIYSHDKRFKQVVQRAKRLNEAISVMRGAPITGAHITMGGYYEAL